MTRLSFEAVWQRILAHTGEEFHTITDVPFTYTAGEKVLHLSHTSRDVSRKNFEIAFALMPLERPRDIPKPAQRRSYVWAILNDSRINPS